MNSLRWATINHISVPIVLCETTFNVQKKRRNAQHQRQVRANAQMLLKTMQIGFLNSIGECVCELYLVRLHELAAIVKCGPRPCHCVQFSVHTSRFNGFSLAIIVVDLSQPIDLIRFRSPREQVEVE